MNLLKEISDFDMGLAIPNDDISYFVRKAARAVLFDRSNKIAVLAVTRDGYHKLPGGGIEAGEAVLEALAREIREEVGAEIEVSGEVGCIIEYRYEFKQIQMSYCYTTRLIGNLSEPNFTENELKHGFKLQWYDIGEALQLMKQDQPLNYVGKFINLRDRIFLEEVLNEPIR